MGGSSGKDLWERAETRIGVISALIALVAAVTELPAKVMDMFDGGEPSAEERALERKRDALAGTSPRVDVSYVWLAKDLVETDLVTPRTRRSNASEATMIRSFPIVENEIVAGEGGDFATGRCRFGELPQQSVAFLVLRNGGRRDAKDVAVELDRRQLERPVRVREAAVGGDDYRARIREGSAETAPVTVRIPQTLTPGSGVRVPLFRTLTPEKRHDRWCIISRTALDPGRVRFADGDLGTKIGHGVRRMRDPVLLESGVVGRG